MPQFPILAGFTMALEWLIYVYINVYITVHMTIFEAPRVSTRVL